MLTMIIQVKCLLVNAAKNKNSLCLTKTSLAGLMVL